MRRPLLTRLERLESGYRQNDGLASDRRRLIQRQALRHLITDQLRCLIELKKAPPRGRQLTSEEAAAAEAFNSAVAAECQKAGFKSLAEFNRYCRHAKE